MSTKATKEQPFPGGNLRNWMLVAYILDKEAKVKACTICIAKFGFKLADKEKTFNNDEELAEHLENFHGRKVKRRGETEKQCVERCKKKGIVEDRTKCQCEECKMLRGEESKITITGVA